MRASAREGANTPNSTHRMRNHSCRNTITGSNQAANEEGSEPVLRFVLGLFVGQLGLDLGGGFTAQAGPGMRAGVDLFEHSDAHLGVNLGCGQFSMSELLLDKSHVRAALQHERDTGVPEQVATPPFAGFGRVDVVADKLGQPARLKRRPEVRQENGAVVTGDDQTRPRLVKRGVRRPTC